MRIAVLVLFFIVTGVHLYASLKQDKKLRAQTKPFILLSLLAFYLLSAEPVMITVVLALIFSWIGDVLLIPPGTKWFTAGGISFMISHAFFVLAYASITDLSKVGLAYKIILPLLFIISSVIIFKYLRPHLPKAPRQFPNAVYPEARKDFPVRILPQAEKQDCSNPRACRFRSIRTSAGAAHFSTSGPSLHPLQKP